MKKKPYGGAPDDGLFLLFTAILLVSLVLFFTNYGSP